MSLVLKSVLFTTTQSSWFSISIPSGLGSGWGFSGEWDTVSAVWG